MVNQQLLARSALERSFVPGADLLLLREKPVLLVVSAKMDGGYESAQKVVDFLGRQASLLRMHNAGTLALEEFPDRAAACHAAPPQPLPRPHARGRRPHGARPVPARRRRLQGAHAARVGPPPAAGPPQDGAPRVHPSIQQGLHRQRFPVPVHDGDGDGEHAHRLQQLDVGRKRLWVLDLRLPEVFHHLRRAVKARPAGSPG